MLLTNDFFNINANLSAGPNFSEISVFYKGAPESKNCLAIINLKLFFFLRPSHFPDISEPYFTLSHNHTLYLGICHVCAWTFEYPYHT